MLQYKETTLSMTQLVISSQQNLVAEDNCHPDALPLYLLSLSILGLEVEPAPDLLLPVDGLLQFHAEPHHLHRVQPRVQAGLPEDPLRQDLNAEPQTQTLAVKKSAPSRSAIPSHPKTAITKQDSRGPRVGVDSILGPSHLKRLSSLIQTDTKVAKPNAISWEHSLALFNSLLKSAGVNCIGNAEGTTC